jgi:hypothetical protein
MSAVTRRPARPVRRTVSSILAASPLLAALGLLLALLPAGSRPASAADPFCPDGEYVAEAVVLYDVAPIRQAFTAADITAVQAKYPDWELTTEDAGIVLFRFYRDGLQGAFLGGALDELFDASDVIVEWSVLGSVELEGARLYFCTSTPTPVIPPAPGSELPRIGTVNWVANLYGDDADLVTRDIICEATYVSTYAVYNTNDLPVGAATGSFRKGNGVIDAIPPSNVVNNALSISIEDAPKAGKCTLSAAVLSPVNDTGGTSGPSWVPTGGSAPLVAPGSGFVQNVDGSTTPLSVTSPTAGQVRYSADGVTVTLTGTTGTSATNGLVAAPSGEIVCVVCTALAAGSTVEVWMFSEPRLVAAHSTDGEDCQTFSIPLGAPLDGGDPVTAGAHTLQLALPTANGMQAVNVGVTVGGPVPSRVPAGEGPVVPAGLLALTLLAAAGAVVAVRRQVVAG